MLLNILRQFRTHFSPAPPPEQTYEPPPPRSFTAGILQEPVAGLIGPHYALSIEPQIGGDGDETDQLRIFLYGLNSDHDIGTYVARDQSRDGKRIRKLTLPPFGVYHLEYHPPTVRLPGNRYRTNLTQLDVEQSYRELSIKTAQAGRTLIQELESTDEVRKVILVACLIDQGIEQLLVPCLWEPPA